jgi:hypothetical protein
MEIKETIVEEDPDMIVMEDMEKTMEIMGMETMEKTMVDKVEI